MKDTIYLAPCGLDCYQCRAYKATINEDENELSTVAKLWSDEGEKLDKHDVRCLGCYSSILYKGCVDCKVRDCVIKRGFENCGECIEYPCQILKKVWQSWKTVSWRDAQNVLNEIKRAQTD